MKKLFKTKDNKISVKNVPTLKVYITDGKIFVSDDDKEWITLENGSHVQLNGEGAVISGASGKLGGKKFSNVKKHSEPKTKNRNIKSVEVVENHNFTNSDRTRPATAYIHKDGTMFMFPKDLNKSHQTMSVEKSMELWNRVPQEIKNHAQSKVEFVDYYNPEDKIWKQTYKDFPSSYATDGEKITFYRYSQKHSDSYVVRTYCHEIGHSINDNYKGKGGIKLCDSTEWKNAVIKDQAISGKTYVTDYGRNSKSEDVAESVALYGTSKELFRRRYPNRARVLDRILK